MMTDSDNALREALEWIDGHADDQDLNHVNFRVGAGSRARAALNATPTPATDAGLVGEDWLGGDWFERWQDATENADDGLMATLESLRLRVERTILAALRTSQPDAIEGPTTSPDDIAKVMSRKWLAPECCEGGCQSLVWKHHYESAVRGRADFRNALREARTALATMTARAEKAEALLREAESALHTFGKEETLEQLYEEDDEWAKFRFLVGDYRRAGRVLTAIATHLKENTNGQ